MVVLIDTNVALDFLTIRQPFYDSAKAILQACANDEIQGYIAFHSLPNIFYILRKSYSDEDRRIMLGKLCLILRVTGASHDRVCEAISRGEFLDFEEEKSRSCSEIFSSSEIIYTPRGSEVKVKEYFLGFLSNIYFLYRKIFY